MKKIIAFTVAFCLLEDAIAASQVASAPVSYSANLIQMLLGLGAIVLMIFGLVWLIKKVGYKGYTASGMIKVKSCLPLSTKEKLMLIEVGDEQLLIGVAPGVISHIKTLDNAVSEQKDNNAIPAPSLFSEKLKAMLNTNTIK